MIGKTVSHYRVLEKVGSGGMGVVYKAEDIRLGRSVALKFLPAEFSGDRQALDRFKREARAASGLDHPNICTIYDIGEDEDQPFIVMQLLNGETLRDRIVRGALKTDDVLDLSTQIADALAAANARRIIHRDIKPANIVTTDGIAKILDFGIAKESSPRSESLSEVPTSNDGSLTSPGSAIGTVAYMSPEQARGEAIDARSDLFSFGAVMYEMATGRPVFSGETTAVIFDSILHKTPPSPAQLNPDISPKLAEIITRALEKDRTLRYQTASDLKADLQRAKRDTSDTHAAGRGNASSGRLRTWRGRTVILGIAVLGVLIFSGLELARYLLRGSGETIDSIAVLPFVNVGGNQDAEYLSDGITESLIDSLSELPNLRVISNSAVARYKGKSTDPKTAGSELGVRAVLTGRITQRGDSLSVGAELVKVADNTALWGEQYNSKVADALTVQSDIASRITERLRLKLSDAQKTRLAKRQTENPEAYQLYLKGRYYAAKFTKEDLDKGFDYFKKAIAQDPNYALAYAGLAYYYNLTTDFLLAPSDVMPKAKEASRKAVELDDSLSEAHVELGSVYLFYDFDWSAAEREFRRAVDLSPNYAPSHEYYAWYLLAVGRIDQGLSEMRIAEKLDPVSVEISSLAGWLAFYARRYDESVTELRRCSDLDPSYWNCYYFISEAFQQQRRFPEAIEALEKADKIVGDDIIVPRAELAHSYAMSGRQTEARRIYDELVARARTRVVSKYYLATIQAALGNKNEALSHLEQAYAERSFMLDFLKTDPELDSLRSEPRFQDLVRQMNFPQ